jgi:miniconductance mechanosensitive channel
MLESISALLINQGLDPTLAGVLTISLAIVTLVLLSLVINYVAKRLIRAGLNYSITHAQTQWDDALLARGVFSRLAGLAPALLIYFITPYILTGNEQLIAIVRNGIFILVIIISVLLADAFLNALFDIYQGLETAREIPLRGLIQTFKLVAYFVGGILIVSIILDRTPLYLLSGLGAFAAVLILVFKDTILGFVAGIQLTANRMVAQGDWVEMPDYDANGSVEDITLTTVKVRNWDRTITTIPTYALISDSFKNWRGMLESDGRRIQRAIYIDVNSIKFCTEAMLEKFSKIQYISAYIEHKKQEVAAYNQAHQVDTSSLVNGRRLTNIGTFRAYVTAYLRNHPMINQEMLSMVRQLPPSEVGLPIEIYVFCKDKAWANYESIQADIFDHFFAIIPEFELRVFQSPTGRDIQQLAAITPEVDYQ